VQALGPRNAIDKKHIKSSITDAIATEVVGSSRADIARKVEVEYERLLDGALIATHIPSLTAGLVRRAMRHLI
jgi:hypothetical protein